LFIIAGPLIVLIAAVLGRALGDSLGFAAAGVIMGVLAIGVWIAIGWWRGGAVGFAAAVVWILPGLINAHVGNGLALLASGAHITDARIGEVESWRGHERVTFGDGELRNDLFGLAGHTTESGGGSRRHSRFDSCTATPIVPAGWTIAQPVKLWSLDDGVASEPFARQTFHPVASPDPDCVRAIDRSIATRQLLRDPSPIFLERVDTLSDPDALRLQGLASAIVPAVIWFLVCASRALARRAP
jgi:hypothetical protein